MNIITVTFTTYSLLMACISWAVSKFINFLIETNSLLTIFKRSYCEVKLLSRVRLFAIPWTVACQAPPSMGFSRQEYWSGLPFPSPGDLPDPEIESGSPALQADQTLLSKPPGNPQSYCMWHLNHTLHMIFYSNLRFYITTRDNRITTPLHD